MSMVEGSVPNRIILTFSFIAVLGIGIVTVFTRYGPGVSGDSVTYVMGAENLVAGNGFSRIVGSGEIEPISGFPPFYSLFLTPVVMFANDSYVVSGLLNNGLMGLNTFLLMYIIYRSTQSIWPSVFSGLVLISSDAMVQTHGWVLSEPVYLTLLLLSVLTLLRYMRQRSSAWLILLGVITAVASLTRYTGLVLLPAIIVFILIFDRRSIQSIALRLGIYILVASTPLLIWYFRNLNSAGSVVNRVIEFRMMRKELAFQYLTEISSWFSPGNLPMDEVLRATLSISLAAGLFGFFLFQVKNWEIRNGSTAATTNQLVKLVSLLYIMGHIGVLLINSFFLDAATTSSAPARYLLPVYIFVLVFFIIIGHELLWNYGFGSKWRWLIAAYLLVVIGTQGIPLYNKLNNASLYVGYSGFHLQHPDVAKSVKDIDRGVPIVSNNPEFIYFLSGRTAYMRPIRYDPYQMKERDDYKNQLEFVQSLLDTGGIYVQLKSPGQDLEGIIADLDLVLMFSHANAGYFYESASSIGAQ
jgi:4-amino-4-deoxy-L-arabinose transferase-like glycosyltransferase